MYYVYENWTRKRAIGHLSDCGYCNNGTGTQGSDSGRNGKWHDCATEDDVEGLLRQFEKDAYVETHWCKACSKRLGKC